MSASEEPKEGAEGAAAAKPARFGKKQKIIAGAAAAVLLLGGGGAAFMMKGSGEKPAAEEEAPAEHAAPAEGEGGEGEGKGAEALMVDVPAMVLNLRTSTGEQRYLKLRFMLVAKDAAKVEEVKSRLPAVIDAYQPFLRELRPEDLAGSEAVFRIKEELLLRGADVLGRDALQDVLIQDLVQQ